MSVGNMEEIIDENHAIVSSSVGPEYYVNILSFVDKDQLSLDVPLSCTIRYSVQILTAYLKNILTIVLFKRSLL